MSHSVKGPARAELAVLPNPTLNAGFGSNHADGSLFWLHLSGRRGEWLSGDPSLVSLLWIPWNCDALPSGFFFLTRFVVKNRTIVAFVYFCAAANSTCV